MRLLKQQYGNKQTIFTFCMLVISQLYISTAMAEDTTDLVNGAKINSLHAKLNGSLFFSINIPDGATDLQIETSEDISENSPFSCFGDGGYSFCNGDSVLYVKQGSIPTLDDYDCLADDSHTRGRKNEAKCSFSDPQAGTYYIRMYANTNFYSASLEASYTDVPSAKIYTANNLTLTQGQWLEYYLDVPAGTTQLKVEMSGGSGDADLYVYDENDEFKCIPWLSGNNETCSFNNPIAVRWSIAVHGYSAASGVNVKVTVIP